MLTSTVVENFLRTWRPEESTESSIVANDNSQTVPQDDFVDATKYFHIHQNKVIITSMKS
jgi:hypothetical protein